MQTKETTKNELTKIGEKGWWLHVDTVDTDECKKKIKNVHTRMDMLVVAWMSIEKRRNKRK